MTEKKFTKKYTTNGQPIYEGDYIEAKTTTKYPLYIGGEVKWDEENQRWLNLDFFDSTVPHILTKLTKEQYLKKFNNFKS